MNIINGINQTSGSYLYSPVALAKGEGKTTMEKVATAVKAASFFTIILPLIAASLYVATAFIESIRKLDI